MQFCKGGAAEILYIDVRSVVQLHSGVFVDLGVLQNHTRYDEHGSEEG
jgi:hypothetical protein